MAQDNATIRDLARVLLQYQACQGKACNDGVAPAGATFEMLRVYLSKLVGVAGFHALLKRALVKATIQCPSLNTLRVENDAKLRGFNEIAPEEGDAALEILLASLLGLLVTFVGEELTIQLLHDVWPTMPLGDIKLGKRSVS